MILNLKLEICQAPMIDAKEAYGFAFLGLQRWLLLDNVLNSVTGASGSTSSGAIWLP